MQYCTWCLGCLSCLLFLTFCHLPDSVLCFNKLILMSISVVLQWIQQEVRRGIYVPITCQTCSVGTSFTQVWTSSKDPARESSSWGYAYLYEYVFPQTLQTPFLNMLPNYYWIPHFNIIVIRVMPENWLLKWVFDTRLLVSEHMLRRWYTRKELIILEKSNSY